MDNYSLTNLKVCLSHGDSWFGKGVSTLAKYQPPKKQQPSSMLIGIYTFILFSLSSHQFTLRAVSWGHQLFQVSSINASKERKRGWRKSVNCGMAWLIKWEIQSRNKPKRSWSMLWHIMKIFSIHHIPSALICNDLMKWGKIPCWCKAKHALNNQDHFPNL